MPGTALSQQQICDAYGTSRIPVRDALRELGHEGLVTLTSGGHAVVARLSVTDVADVWQLQALAHALAVRRATESASDEEIGDVERLHRELVAAVDAGEFSSVVDLNREFHRQINELAPSPKVQAVIRAGWMSLPDEYLELDYPKATSRANREHGAIVSAMKRRDPDRAAELMQRHIEASGENLTRYLRSRSLLV
jgi:DNA-binding GntR family transcriptional regulator